MTTEDFATEWLAQSYIATSKQNLCGCYIFCRDVFYKHDRNVVLTPSITQLNETISELKLIW